MSNSPNELSGKVAIVTGGSGVLGSAAVRALAQEGARVAILGRKLEPMSALVKTLEKNGAENLAIAADCLDRAALEKARTQIRDRWGRIDFLLNFAGGNRP